MNLLAASGPLRDRRVRDRRSAPAGTAPARAAATGRALVPLASVGGMAVHPPARPSAAFLAHLIATHRNLPQARERRRAEPREAILAYTATARSA
jgi:hypothetical protein